MSKTYDTRYLDENKTLLRTANNLVKQALDTYNDAYALEKQQGPTPLIIANYTTARNQLAEALLSGKIDACAGLAFFNQQGIGGPVSPYNQKLFLTIGSKLGNQKCTAALAQLQHNNYNVEKEANIWVKHINTYKIDLDKEITTRELADNLVFLENALRKDSISLETLNTHILIVKSKEEIAATNYTMYPPPKPEVNYYDPNHHNTTTTSSAPLEVSQAEPLGQVPNKYFCCGCNIL